METTQPSRIRWREQTATITSLADDKEPTTWVICITPNLQKKSLRLSEVLTSLPKFTQTVGTKDLNVVCWTAKSRLWIASVKNLA